jgi:hypothetical protein
MTTVKLSQLTELTTPSSNTEQTFLLVTDTQSGSPISKRMSVKTLDTLIDVTQGQANLAFNHANAAFIIANAAFVAANTPTAYANASFTEANNALAVAQSAFSKANSGSNIATNLAVTGNTTITSNVRVGGNITPTTSLTSNLGNSDFRFHSLFLGSDSVYLGSNLSIGAVTYPGYIGGSVDAIRIKNSSYLITGISFDDGGMIHHSNVSGSPVISITDTLGYLSRLEGSFAYSSTNTTSYWANTAPIDVQSAIDRITVAVYQLRDNIANGTAITTSLIE